MPAGFYGETTDRINTIDEREEFRMNLKGSKTEQNLMTAFAGESQARNKYTYYASKAKKEGFNQIGDLFLETANNEKNMQKFGLSFHDGEIADTMTNLKDDAAAGENYEWTDMYATFAKEAKKASTRSPIYLKKSRKIEKEHEERYLKLLSNLTVSSYSPETAIRFGSARIADTSILEKTRRRFARYVITRSLISKSKRKTINLVLKAGTALSFRLFMI